MASTLTAKRRADLASALRVARRRLIAMYGRRPPRVRGTGLDVLVEAMLSQNTNMVNSTRGYRALRRRFPTWTGVMNAAVDDVQREIAICGLARMRARRLQAMLRRIKTERGGLSIQFLADAGLDAARAYLTSFHGVGPKTAAYVSLFAFGHPVLPVDNGVLRVARRLRWVRPIARDAEAERLLSPLIAKGRHYELHVLLFAHAKARCTPRNPKCDDCALLPQCPYGRRRVRHLPPPESAIDLPLRRRPRPLAGHISAGLAKADDRPRGTPV